MSADLAGMDRKVRAIADAMKRVLKDVGDQTPYWFQAFAEERFHEGAPSGPGGSGDKLHVRSGALTRSLVPGQPGSASKVKVTKDGVRITVGSSLIYAKVHEDGMFVKSKGKMHTYFWAKYYETSLDYYKYIALAVKKNGGVRIPARPWFEPAKRQFRLDGKPMIASLMRDEIRAALRRL